MFPLALAREFCVNFSSRKTNRWELGTNHEIRKDSFNSPGNAASNGVDSGNGCLLEDDSMKQFPMVALIFCSVLGCSQLKKSSVVPEWKIPEQSIEISRTRFWKEYEVNPVRAEEMLKNKRVRIKDKLSYINQSVGVDKLVTLGFGVGGPEIRKSLYDTENLDSAVDFIYPESFRSQIVPLNPGQTVTLEGVFKGVDIDRRTLSFVGIAILTD
jgi:hypothetical protein